MLRLTKLADGMLGCVGLLILALALLSFLCVGLLVFIAAGG